MQMISCDPSDATATSSLASSKSVMVFLCSTSLVHPDYPEKRPLNEYCFSTLQNLYHHLCNQKFKCF